MGGAVEIFTSLTQGEQQYYSTVRAYIEQLTPDQPKYLSGVEAAVSQLGHFLFRVFNNCPMDNCSNLLKNYSSWFSKLHPKHQLIIPQIGDGFDNRFHKDVSREPIDGDMALVVEMVVNWGLLEIGSSPRTVFKAQIKCRS